MIKENREALERAHETIDLLKLENGLLHDHLDDIEYNLMNTINTLSDRLDDVEHGLTDVINK